MKEMHKVMDLACRGALCFHGDMLYFDDDEDDILNDEKSIYVVDIRAYL